MTNQSRDPKIPVITAFRIRHYPRTRLATVFCPHCGGKHFHGWPYGELEIGHRVADCSSLHPAKDRSTPGYYIEPPEGYTPSEE